MPEPPSEPPGTNAPGTNVPPGRSARCPVCGRPAGPDTECRDCGWTLHTPWRLGPADLEAERADLDAARLAADLRAAARLGDDWRERAALLRGVPDDAAWAAARDAARVTVQPAAPVLAAALAGLPDGGTLIVLEVTAEGVTATPVNELGRAEEPVRTRSWTELLPALSPDRAVREFQLAGGDHELDRTALRPALAAALEGWVGPLPPTRVAICRTPGLPLPELAVGLLATLTAAEPGELAPLLEEVAGTLPIRTGYGLLIAQLEPGTERVAPALRELLPAGSCRGAAGDLTVYRAPGTSPPTTLAVCTVESPPRLIAAWRATLPPSGPVAVRAVLDGPGLVRLTDPAALDPEPRMLPGILDDLPTWYRPPPPLLELVCLLELNGPSAAVARRRELLGELLALLSDEVPDRLRATVLGYSDHFVRKQTFMDVVHGGRFAPPAGARGDLGRLPEPVEPYSRDAAPLEDALATLADGGAGSAPRALLTVAGRDPHPFVSARDGRGITACPRGLDATAVLARVPAGHRVAVLDRLPESPAPFWRALGAHGLLGLDDARPGDLAARLGLLPADPGPFSVPLAHPL